MKKRSVFDVLSLQDLYLKEKDSSQLETFQPRAHRRHFGQRQEIPYTS